MVEYIKKWHVVDKLTALENELQQYKPFRPCEATMYRRICDTEIDIGKMDSEDVAPVRHGVWKTIIEGNVSKSVCCTSCEHIFYTLIHGELQIDRMLYCPNCGARMDLEEA